MQLQHSIETSAALSERYLELTSRLSALLRERNDSASQIFDDARLERFVQLDRVQQTALLEKLEMFYVVMSEPIALRRSPNQDLVRAALSRFGWKASSQMLRQLGDSDTAEIYGTDFTLKFANMRFLQLCSYNLEEVLTHEFKDLFVRDRDITSHLLGCASKISKGEAETLFDLGPDHTVTEVFSQRKRRIWVQSRFVTGVYTKWNTLAGYLYSASASVLDPEN